MGDTTRIIEAICAHQWAITEPGLQLVLSVADRSRSDVAAVLAARGDNLAGTKSAVIRNGVAVLPIRGPIFRYANVFTDVSNATSLDVLATDFGTAVRNPGVRSIVLEVDSPGGMVSGVSEFAAQVREATREKRVVAYISDESASAAYWISAAASEIVIADTARAGSIGCVMQAMREPSADSVKFISSQSPNKHLSPESDAGQRVYQAQVNALAQVFIESVARYRAVSVETVMRDFGQGGVMVGRAAVSAGLADRVGSLESVIAGLAGQSPAGGASMSQAKEPPQGFSEAVARAEYQASPALQAEFRTEGTYMAFARANAAGRVSFVRAAGSKGESEPGSTFDESAHRARFEQDETLRQDFRSVESYLAYARAYASGQARVISK